MRSHVDFLSAKRDTLRTQADLLLLPRMAAQQNASARTHHTVPRQIASCSVQRPRYLPGRARKPGRLGNLPVSGNLRFWNTTDRAKHGGKHTVWHTNIMKVGRLRISLRTAAGTDRP